MPPGTTESSDQLEMASRSGSLQQREDTRMAPASSLLGPSDRESQSVADDTITRRILGLV